LRRIKCLPCWIAFACFCLPLIPVSQVFASIQNYHADRYLLLSVLGASLAWSIFVESLGHSPRVQKTLIAVLLGWLSLQTGYRAYLFAEPARLFRNATERTFYSGAPAYQWGVVLEEQGRLVEAIQLYDRAIRRPDAPSEAGRRATNNSARVYAQLSNLAQAERVLRKGRLLWPFDPKIAGNLAEIVWRSGRKREAKALFEQAMLEFPEYQVVKQNYGRHFGQLEH
jgi:tetratricopeptide (TPR) repeat protein